MIGYPLVLRHADVQRIINRSASHLILTAAVKPGTHQIQDAQIVRRNERHRKQGRYDLQHDPTIRTVEVRRRAPGRARGRDGGLRQTGRSARAGRAAC